MKKTIDWLKGLSLGNKILLGVVASFFLIGIGGASNSPSSQNLSATDTAPTTAIDKRKPTITTKTETETQPVPFTSSTVEDPALTKGSTTIRTAGVNGVKTLTYKVTYSDGTQTGKKLVSEAVTTPPVSQVTAIGTYVKPASSCDPNYSGACVPIASDVDCAGGSGNGPAYVSGPVSVVGSDIYGLDRNGDGVGCE
ncbi:MAG: G5 domain-containing protein [Patescibacteria group bacterium]